MGVYIKGMEMPKGCATCPYCDRAWNKPKCKAKSMQGRFMEQRLNLDRTRQKWCPLVPVPPHGRLKEEEWLKKIISRAIEINASIEPRSEAVEQERRCLWWFEQQIGIAPTIIPAEEGE